MTEEEYREYQRLVSEYEYLVSENNRLIDEINYAQESMVVLAGNMAAVSSRVVPEVRHVSEQVSGAGADIGTLMKALEELTDKYFVFKELSTASKNLTQYNDEYFSKFAFFNELRRITLGYIIGLDSHIISSEALRKKVEKCYLANTDYWLAYAIMSVMLWADDEKEAAYRALRKALKLDCKKSAVFYMLVNLRFTRTEAASRWYLRYLDRTDVNDLGAEWQKLLRAYLSGALGNDPKLEYAAKEYFRRIFEQTQALSAGYSLRVQSRAEEYLASFPYTSNDAFPALSLYCIDHPALMDSLSDAGKTGAAARYFDGVASTEEPPASGMNERIENVLYDLINSYDEKELEVVKKIKYSEAVIAARGDVSAAQKRFFEQYGKGGEKLNAGEMLLKWAFSEDFNETDITVKRFALSQLGEDIVRGFKNRVQKVRESAPERFRVNIDGCELVCSRSSFDESAAKLRDHFLKNRLGAAMKDKQFIIFLLVCAGSLLLLGAAALFVKTPAFSVLLALGIVSGIVGGFLVWRRYVDIGRVLAENHRRALVRLRDVFGELEIWRRRFDAELLNDEALFSAIGKFTQ